ncbi:hypothetical protein GA0061098_10901, partial [Bradyrhizobium shewense]
MIEVDVSQLRGRRDLPLNFHPAAVSVSGLCEVLTKTRPVGAGIFRGYAHAGGGADEPFNS